MVKRNSQPNQLVQKILANASQEHGIPYDVLKRFAGIESTFKPGARTGQYQGLFQLSKTEFKRGGGNGSRFDPVQNTKAFANILKSNIKQFTDVMGRPPKGWETYLVHQQGIAGGPAHLQNPDQPAWKSMYSTSEGRRKGVGWSKKAIWGNVPSTQKKQFGKVENVTSGQFTQLWKARYAREGGGMPEDAGFDPSPAGTPPVPERMASRRVGGSDSDQVVAGVASQADQNVVMVGGGDPPPVPDRRAEMRSAENSPQTPGRRPKYQYRAAEYESANDIGAGGPPSPERNPQDAPEAPRSALIPGTPEAGRSGSRLTEPVGSGGGGGVAGGGFDPMAQRAFGGSFGELYARPDQGSALLKDVLPSGRPTMGANGQPPPRPPMFRDFFQGLFGGFGG